MEIEPDAEDDLERPVAAAARILVGREPQRHADVALRLACGALGDCRIDAVAAHEQRGDVGDGWHPQPDAAHPRADRRDEVGLARRAQDPHRARRRLLERLEQHVRGALGHAVGILDDHHPVAGGGRRELRARHQLAHLVDGDDHPVGAEQAEVRMGARLDEQLGVSVVLTGAEQRRGEGLGEVRPPGAGRTGDQPGVGHRRVG